MGELPDIYVERIRREYKVDVEVESPKGELQRSPNPADRLRLQA